ncbi:hypothetical protein FAZ69_07820 [Trinickia terrae]|uniref:Uncharacterized protein n=1 Tax=Trinickia terrae TaxID=2571161 RepID=A0A4U1I990_9BURK|nr:hypothetical protein [Trinickia terrae]TKC90061.1 hypothetical protein FAZ69_07820 [Trinickia terrae]
MTRYEDSREQSDVRRNARGTYRRRAIQSDIFVSFNCREMVLRTLGVLHDIGFDRLAIDDLKQKGVLG